MKLLLGSNSPRRKELLQSMGFAFEPVSIDCEEVFPENLAAEKVAAYLAELKALAFRPLAEGEVLLTADTVVVMEEILGKPQNSETAHAMLRSLSGKTHKVYTACTLKSAKGQTTFTDVAEVTFSEISDEEIQYYLENHRPYDKAGSYGIQEWLGMAKVSGIRGSYYTIMGLPTHLVYEQLKLLGD